MKGEALPATAPVVAIDGPAGSGKSTVARAVAEALGFLYVDTGAMYRAVTLKVLRDGRDPADEKDVEEALEGISIGLERTNVFLNGADVSHEIRTGDVTRNVSAVSSHPKVREFLVKEQRRLAEGVEGSVMEGRDIGTVVFPNARWKFYLDADPRERARRRQAELAAAGRRKELDWVLRDILERDRRDSEREVSPLRKASDAVEIDTSDLAVEEVVERIVRYVRGEA
ncbi:MAG: (d)CMP kinase [Candidatus Hydrogenedentota bacterium]|nr:MAG: (d)CMP kinase [Candidatus Hydrogenedentota bacterium]